MRIGHALLAAALMASLGHAANAQPYGRALEMEDADDMVPGDYVWRPDASPSGAVRIDVDIDRQFAYVYRGGRLIGISTVSSGREGYETATGVFQILQKAPMHRSNKYESAPMPFMERLTWDGVALHAGGVPDHPSSHGCIHLPSAFAKKLYAVTRLGDVVDVEDGTPFTDEERTASTDTVDGQ